MFKPIEIPEQKSVEIPGFIRKAYDILCQLKDNQLVKFRNIVHNKVTSTVVITHFTTLFPSQQHKLIYPTIEYVWFPQNQTSSSQEYIPASIFSQRKRVNVKLCRDLLLLVRKKMNEEGCGKKVDVVRKGYNGESEYEQQRVVEMEKGRYQEKEMCEMGQRGCQMNQLAQSKALIGQVLNGDTIFYPGEFLASTRLINMSLKKLSQISFSEIISEGYDGQSQTRIGSTVIEDDKVSFEDSLDRQDREKGLDVGLVSFESFSGPSCFFMVG